VPTGIITPKDQVDQRNSITDENGTVIFSV
jgi:hypothetical protein